jgi:hypothetical protein
MKRTFSMQTYQLEGSPLLSNISEGNSTWDRKSEFSKLLLKGNQWNCIQEFARLEIYSTISTPVTKTKLAILINPHTETILGKIEWSTFTPNIFNININFFNYYIFDVFVWQYSNKYLEKIINDYSRIIFLPISHCSIFPPASKAIQIFYLPPFIRIRAIFLSAQQILKH